MDLLANHSIYHFWQTIVFVIFGGGPVLILVPGPGLALNGPAHPENLLISMITDDQKHTGTRELGIRLTLKVRHHPQSFSTRQAVR